MAHCPFELLNDVEDLLEEIRKLKLLKESKPGIFYLKGKGFLHFHIDKENRRWADIRDGADWGQPVDLPFTPSKKLQKNFIEEVRSRYNRLSEK